MPGIEYKFDIHYKEKQDDTDFKRAPNMTEEQFLEWVKTNATKVWYFDVYVNKKVAQKGTKKLCSVSTVKFFLGGEDCVQKCEGFGAQGCKKHGIHEAL